MKISNLTRFPHPVLSVYSDDYVSGSFSIEVEIKEHKTSGHVDLNYSVVLDCDDINSLIKDNLAKPVMYVVCRRTYYNKLHELDMAGGGISFNRGELFGSVILRPIICANELIEGYSPTSLHDEFGSSSWSFRHSDILAIAPEFRVNIGLDKLAPMETIFNIVTNNEVPDGETRVVLEEHKICIVANEKTRKGIEALRSSFDGKSVLLNGVYLPVIMQVLDAIRQDASSFETKRWYEVFEAKCLNENIDLGNPDLLEDAQKLLRSPLNRIISKKSFRYYE